MSLHIFSIVLRGIWYRPLRSYLTILGIVIGVMLVVVIFALGGGVQGAVGRALRMFGSDLIVIFPGRETNPLAGFIGEQKFREKDLYALENISGVRFVVPMEAMMMNMEYRGEKKSGMVHAAPWRGMIETYEESQGIRLEKGRWPASEDAAEAVLGYRAASDLFQHPIQVGDVLLISSKRVQVVGIVSEIGNQMDDNVVYISLNLFRKITGRGGGVGSAFLKVRPEADIRRIAAQVKQELSQQTAVNEFSVLTPEKSVRLIGDILDIVELSLMIVALISLVVGAVGVMNTMYTAVLERTKEIGILKAIGATNEAILSLFLMESGIIGLIGGIIGIVFGIFAAYLVSLAASRYGIVGLFSLSSLDYSGFLVVLIVTFLTGIFAGVLPARQASRLEPAEALRYE